MKLCKGCNSHLSLDCFNKHTETKDGYRSKCKECRRLEHIAYRRNNPEKIKELQKICDKRKLTNPEYILRKRYTNKQYNASEVGKLKNKIRQQKWNAANKAKRNAIHAARRFSKKNATPTWLSDKHKQEILDFYTVCEMFKTYTGFEYHVDHIIPLRGKTVCGLHVPWNLQILTASENKQKSNKLE